MTTPNDVVLGQEAPGHAPARQRGDDNARADSLFREINERRARIENAELLQQLRGL